MKLIIGLGNPGKKYEKTRHNVGFMVVEQFFKDFEPVKETVWENSEKLKSDIAQLIWQPKHGKEEKVILAKPKTYMNNSGMAIGLLAKFYKVAPEDMWFVYDEFDLPLGSMKIRFGGASAGHHGINSVMESLVTDKFWRFRMGIGLSLHREKPDADGKQHPLVKQEIKNANDFVLKGFTGRERGKVRELIKRGAKAIATALEENLETAMNRFNTK